MRHPLGSSLLLATSLLFAAVASSVGGCDDAPPPASTAPPPKSSPTSEASAPAASATPTPSATAAPGATATPLPSASAVAPPLATVGIVAPPADAGASKVGPQTTSKPDAGAAPSLDAGLAPSDAGAVADAASEAGATAAPAAGSADAVAADVDAIYTGKKAFTARFQQEHTQKISGVVKRSSGVLFVERPNKISFRYDPPNGNRIVSDGTTMKIYVQESEQMIVQPVAGTEYPGALSFIMGRGMLESFSFTFHDKAKWDGGPVLLGKPRVPTPSYETVLFYIDDALRKARDPGTIRRVLIVDVQGNRNRFDFEKASQPASVDPAELTFTPPAGTSIQGG